MGTVAEKLTYLNGTKSSLKTAINNLGGDIDNSTTFRNYATELNDIYDNLPKVSDTGTNVSLSPTLKGRLGIVPKGNTLQDGEPTPETPIEIQSATGTQKVVVSGKNLFDKDNVKYINAYANATTGVLISASANTRTIYVPCKSNTTYTIQKGIVTPTNSNRFQIGTSASVPKAGDTLNDFWAMSDGGTITSHTITTGNNANYLVCFCYVAGTTTSWEDFIGTIQIEQGSTSTSYQPYQEPQEVDIELDNIELNKIGDYEDYIGGTPDNWVLYKILNKMVLKSNMNWQDRPNYSYADRFVCDNVFPTQKRNMLSNYFKVNYATDDTFPYLTDNRTQCIINFSAKGTTTLTEFKNFLDTHNVEVLYPLAETQQTPITEENLVSQLNELYYLQSYNDTTNIDVTGNLPMRITASAIKGA